MELSQYLVGELPFMEQLYIDVFTASEGRAEGLSIGCLVHNLLHDTSKEDIYGFVAKDKGKIIAAILFTRLTFQNDISAFILSPVAVDTKHQRKGIGQRLITFGLDFLKANEVELVFTYGDPAYYSQVGFQSISEDKIQAPQKMSMPQGWLCQSLFSQDIEPINGPCQCVPALAKPEYW